ncbi:hypothetical protein SPRG_14219 [Saprolegnia parasitica CBS 223.65]|uniref:Uncharacterized protein n=1 Tax=Saprolegnia parasitica (strain CBS 223.65) TaxID=695850 RepID=A0A067C0I3_SAPPC|nr:hypothetical protein SPRG_14219 [Saprolegnia parasitica CBS 223.65]KDO20071.1 hypothetical protein SPRG_14219 [Saprolegnia parasitica CBS 223.65]|eukprot:XP_012209231.1 hypothetical protein SPRG_14219 [Saprolegnia parasitica CBS 223.65]
MTKATTTSARQLEGWQARERHAAQGAQDEKRSLDKVSCPDGYGCTATRSQPSGASEPDLTTSHWVQEALEGLLTRLRIFDTNGDRQTTQLAHEYEHARLASRLAVQAQESASRCVGAEEVLTLARSIQTASNPGDMEPSFVCFGLVHVCFGLAHVSSGVTHVCFGFAKAKVDVGDVGADVGDAGADVGDAGADVGDAGGDVSNARA